MADTRYSASLLSSIGDHSPPSSSRTKLAAYPRTQLSNLWKIVDRETSHPPPAPSPSLRGCSIPGQSIQPSLTKPLLIVGFESDDVTPVVDTVTATEAHVEFASHEQKPEVEFTPTGTIRSVGLIDGDESMEVLQHSTLNRVRVSYVISFPSLTRIQKRDFRTMFDEEANHFFYYRNFDFENDPATKHDLRQIVALLKDLLSPPKTYNPREER